MSSVTDSLAAGVCLSLAEGYDVHTMAVLYAWVSLNAIIVVALLAGVNIVLRRWSKVFRGLEAEQQLVATYHSSYTLLYLAIFFPMTYYGMRLVFPPSDSVEATVQRMQSDFVPTFILITLNCVFYISEAGARTIIKPNWMLMLHHCVHHAIIIMGFLKTDVLTLKHGICLDTFATYEVALFATLAARRLQLPHRLVVATWWTGMVLYTATRVIQTTILIWLFVATYSEMNGCGKIAMWWANFWLNVLFTVVQLYTFPIYLGVLKRSAAAVKRTLSRVSASMTHRLSMSKSKGARSQREADLAAVVASPPAEAEGGRDGSNGGSAGVKSAKDLESAGPSAAKSPEGQAKSLEGQP